MWGTGKTGVNQMQLLIPTKLVGSWVWVKLVLATRRALCGVAKVLKETPRSLFSDYVGAKSGWSFEW